MRPLLPALPEVALLLAAATLTACSCGGVCPQKAWCDGDVAMTCTEVCTGDCYLPCDCHPETKAVDCAKTLSAFGVAQVCRGAAPDGVICVDAPVKSCPGCSYDLQKHSGGCPTIDGGNATLGRCADNGLLVTCVPLDDGLFYEQSTACEAPRMCGKLASLAGSECVFPMPDGGSP